MLVTGMKLPHSCWYRQYITQAETCSKKKARWTYTQK